MTMSDIQMVLLDLRSQYCLLRSIHLSWHSSGSNSTAPEKQPSKKKNNNPWLDNRRLALDFP